MQQVLHLLIVDRVRRAALAARHCGRWLLPVISCGEMVRAAPLVARWCAQRGLASDVAGQWLGRVGPDATDWLMAIPARTGCPAADALEWIPLDALSSGASVLDYQTWALARSLDRSALPSVEGPFGNLEWPEAVRAWIGEFAGSPADAWTPYRVAAHEVVLGAETACGRVYFKGLAAERALEAAVTGMFASVAPDSFAPTLALERHGGASMWWLTEECAGRPSRDTSLVASALGRLQQRLMPTARESTLLERVDLDTVAHWACGRSGDSGLADLIREASAKVMRSAVPQTWIPMDLDPTNVLADAEGVVRFIDADDSLFGPAPLAMAVFARRCGDTAAYRTYEQSWSPSLTGVEWRSIEIGAAVVQVWLGWNRLSRNMERGEVYAPLDLVDMRIRDRLARAVIGDRSPCQAPRDDRAT
jgi:hypothetical protein